jgi:hypothetical protein
MAGPQSKGLASDFRADCERVYREWHCKNRSKPAPDFGRKRQVISAESGT